MTQLARKLTDLSSALHQGLRASQLQGDLSPIAEHLVRGLIALGLNIDRLQLPLSSFFGFRHPFYVGLIVTWTLDEGVNIVWRERGKATSSEILSALRQSPFSPLLFDQQEEVRYTPLSSSSMPILLNLAQRGYIDYYAIRLTLPDQATQVLSIATLAQDGFNEQALELLRGARNLIAISLYAAYQHFTTQQIAHTYLGRQAGDLVLRGEFYRGNAEQISALILFADIRNFTSLSERAGALKVTEYVNQAFEVIDTHLQPLGGEILKFMGDAALIVFPEVSAHRENTTPDVPDEYLLEPVNLASSNKLQQISSIRVAPLIEVITALKAVLSEVQSIEINEDTDDTLELGVGLHIGDVVFGNIGARTRLDFTVMGPAVNLASRLEGLTKSLNCSLLLSGTTAERIEPEKREALGLKAFPPQNVKGVTAPVSVWGLPR